MTSDKNIGDDSLEFHAQEPRGKIGIELIKPLANQRDLSLAYSPGVAAPCEEIAKNPKDVFKYTAKGNRVAVISNGTAVLGLGNLGALASIPVMEGKAALFKRFADIDAYDIVVSTEDPTEFVNVVKHIGGSHGGINLEDISAPACFIIEEELKRHLDIPVFHDDQHGTAIITVAGLMNAVDLTKRNFTDLKIVVNGAGAAAIACIELIKNLGVKSDNVILCDTKGTIYKGRTDNMNLYKERHATDTKARTLQEALIGADVFLGLSVKDAVSEEMIATMAKNPIIFAMANPDPEISPETIVRVRPDAIFATGRSDYPNQVNNVMGFPYIFRGALDVRAKTINFEMKIAAAKALAKLAKEDVPESVSAAYSGKKLKYGRDYIIPTPFDPRLIVEVPLAVARAACTSGVAQEPIEDWEKYKDRLQSRLNPYSGLMNTHYNQLMEQPKKLIFAEGDDEQMIRAAVQWRNRGFGTPVLVGNEENILRKLDSIGVSAENIEIDNAAKNPHTDDYIDKLYTLLQRKGYLYRDCARMIKRDRNVFSAMLLQSNEADAMITGLTRSYVTCIDEVMKVIDVAPNRRLMGLSVLISKGQTIFVADTTITESPKAAELVEIACQAAHELRLLGHEPRVAFISFSNFGNPMRDRNNIIREAVNILDKAGNVDFEYEGEMQAEVALSKELQKIYPFCRLKGPANLLIMPGLHSANISTQLFSALGGGKVVGHLCGLSKPVQVVQMGAKEADIVNMAALTLARTLS